MTDFPFTPYQEQAPGGEPHTAPASPPAPPEGGQTIEELVAAEVAKVLAAQQAAIAAAAGVPLPPKPETPKEKMTRLVQEADAHLTDPLMGGGPGAAIAKLIPVVAHLVETLL